VKDGTVEKDIPSRELFPIHALDEQEYFPGDCVVGCGESFGGNFDPHAYGVVQSVDHSGRTCKVQWFKTYTTGNEPK
jgi:ubiquitin-conjugating enzyme E2 O